MYCAGTVLSREQLHSHSFVQLMSYRCELVVRNHNRRFQKECNEFKKVDKLPQLVLKRAKKLFNKNQKKLHAAEIAGWCNDVSTCRVRGKLVLQACSGTNWV